MLDPEVIRLVKEAIFLEIRGRDFFLHAAETTRNSLGRKMFERLARDEIEHMKVFGEFFTAVTEGEEWKKFVKARGREDQKIIDHLKTRVKNAEREQGASDLEAIRIGMELERKAIEFFSDLASRSTSSQATEIAKKICEEEKSHYDLLQAQYDSVQNSGFWFDVAEFRLDGEY